MDKQPVPETKERNTSEVEGNDTHGSECQPFHLKLLVMFALKTFMDKEIEDFRVWTVRSDEVIEESLGSHIFIYKRIKSSEDDCGWTCLIVSCKKQKVFTEITSATILPESQDLVHYFKIFTRLKCDPDITTNLKSIKKIVLCGNHSGWLKLPQNMTEFSLEKDVIFGTGLLKLKDDFMGRKEFLEKMIEQCSPLCEEQVQGGCTTESQWDHLRRDAQEFNEKAVFVTECSDWEDLQPSLKMLIGNYAGITDSDEILERLMKAVQELLNKRSGQNVISSYEFKNLFEKVENVRGERVTLRFNLSDAVSDFVGRGKELREMLHILEGKSEIWKGGPYKHLVLSGLGGVGKSELTREYCRRHFISVYDNIIWINAENPEGLRVCFQTLAFERLGIEKLTPSGGMKDVFTVIKEAMDQLKKRRTLLIYDNAVSLQEMKKYLPCYAADGCIHVILTSRFQDWKGFHVILLDNFHPKEALNLVKRSLGHLPCWNDDDGQELCQNLSYYPLALKQALSYIHKQCTLSEQKEKNHIVEYMQLLKEKTEFMLDHSMLGDAYAETSYNIVMNVVQNLKKSLQDQMALTLFNIISYLSPDCVDVEDMSNALPKFSREVVLNSFFRLSKLSVVCLDGSTARIHRMVQTVNRIRLKKLGLEVDVLRDAMHYALEMNATHVISVWEFVSAYADLVKEFSMAPRKACDILISTSQYETALEFSESVLPLLKAHFGNYSPEVMGAETTLSQSYFLNGKYDKAERLMEEYLMKWSKTSECNNDDYILIMFLYGDLLDDLERNDESLSIFNKLLSLDIALKDNPMFISLIKLKIATLLLKKGVVDEEEWKNLEQWSREAFKTIRTQVEMVGLISDWNHVMPTHIKHLKNVNMMSGHQGVSCRDIFMVLICFQSLPEKTGQWEESYEVTKWCIDLLSKHDLKSKNMVKNGKVHLASMLIKMGKLEVALNELETLLSELNVENDEKIIFAVNLLLSQTLCSLGKFSIGIPKVLSLCFNTARNAVLDEGLNGVLAIIKDTLNSGHFDEVSHIMVELFSMMERNVGKDGIPDYFLDSCVGICNKLFFDGLKKVEAMELLKNVYQCLKLKFGESHTMTLRAKINFARFYCWFGKKNTFNKGISYLWEVHEILQSRFHERDPLVRKLVKQVETELLFYLKLDQVTSLNHTLFSNLNLGFIKFSEEGD